MSTQLCAVFKCKSSFSFKRCQIFFFFTQTAFYVIHMLLAVTTELRWLTECFLTACSATYVSYQKVLPLHAQGKIFSCPCLMHIQQCVAVEPDLEKTEEGSQQQRCLRHKSQPHYLWVTTGKGWFRYKNRASLVPAPFYNLCVLEKLLMDTEKKREKQCVCMCYGERERE